MSESGKRPGTSANQETISRSPDRLQPNPAIGWLCFFVWLTPTAVLIGCFPLNSWLVNTFSRSQIWTPLSFALGFAAILFCGWFDSQLAVVCRSGIRYYGHHIIIFVITQILVIPAVLFAVLFAVCAASSM